MAADQEQSQELLWPLFWSRCLCRAGRRLPLVVHSLSSPVQDGVGACVRAPAALGGGSDQNNFIRLRVDVGEGKCRLVFCFIFYIGLLLHHQKSAMVYKIPLTC